MSLDAAHWPYLQTLTRLSLALAIGLFIGIERERRGKDAGLRTFSFAALIGGLGGLLGEKYALLSIIMLGVLVVFLNIHAFYLEHGSELTTSAALLITGFIGILCGQGHTLTPAAVGILTAALLAWKGPLVIFSDKLSEMELRSAILLAIIGFVIYPLLPNEYVDRWNLFNPSDAWISIIAIAGIGFLNYIFLRIFSSQGLYLGAVFGGLVNSTATIAEMSSRVNEAGTPSRITTLSSLINVSMFTRNMVLAAIFAPMSLTATLLPLLAMSCMAGVWMWHDHRAEKRYGETETPIQLTSPLEIKKILSFGLLFIVIQVSGGLFTRLFGNAGMLITSFIGGLISSASTTAAAATMAMHGQITPALAGNAAIISSMASAMIDFPFIWRNIKEKSLIRSVTWKLATVLLAGVIAVLLNHFLHVSERIVALF
ncbi:MAG: MgtC/SapB family protein [Anaerolineaceae bacterium]|jgi:uncharacterized membrane protein (DUF4010 family)|nr:MgtC/SapB family protein [Anaerolineaceae bacterium]OQY91068.1 MAG: hypothetical protein B6D38_00280 [Anaerolineae bacterium UTCFX1]